MQISNNPLLVTQSSGFNDKKTPERLPVVIDAEQEFQLDSVQLYPTGDYSENETDITPVSYTAYSQPVKYIRSFSSQYEHSLQSNQPQVPSSIQQYLQIAENKDERERGIFINEKV